MDRSEYLDIAAIVGQYVKLTPEGTAHYLGKCPFCTAPEDSLMLSKETQFWHCLSCGLNGDKYDFVARSENIRRAEAILMVGHHAVSGEPFPHARFKARAPSPKPAETPARAPAAAAPPPRPAEAPKTEPARAKAPPGTASAPPGGAETFLEFRNIIASYQGAAILDDQSRVIVFDSDFASSADLADIGKILAPILAQAASVFAKSGTGAGGPATLTFASERLAIIAHKFGPAAESMLLVVRLADPGDVFAARRLLTSASAKLK